MTELEVMRRAKMYIDRMANGVNPIDGAPVPDENILNDVRISRCLFYVSDILRQVIENGGVIGSHQTIRKAYIIPDVRKFALSETPISASEISRRLNDIIDLETCRKYNYTVITSWLIEIGALEVRSTAEGKNVKQPTPQGNALGISEELRTSAKGEYTVVVYNKEASSSSWIILNPSSVPQTPQGNSRTYRPQSAVKARDLRSNDKPVLAMRRLMIGGGKRLVPVSPRTGSE